MDEIEGAQASLPAVHRHLAGALEAGKMPATRTQGCVRSEETCHTNQSPGATNSLKHGAIP